MFKIDLFLVSLNKAIKDSSLTTDMYFYLSGWVNFSCSHIKLHGKSPWVHYNYCFRLLNSANNLLNILADVSAFRPLASLLGPLPFQPKKGIYLWWWIWPLRCIHSASCTVLFTLALLQRSACHVILQISLCWKDERFRIL